MNQKKAVYADMPACHCRWGKRIDIPAAVEIARAVACPWDECDFTEELRNRAVILHVAECKQTGSVRAFAVTERTTSGGRVFLDVLELGAGDPVARWALIDWLNERADKQGYTLHWIEPKY